MKKLLRKEMKLLKGGIVAPPGSTYGSCSATATCQNGSTITKSCTGWNVVCTGSDYGVSNGGGSWSNSPGIVYCSATGLTGGTSLDTIQCLN